MPSFLYLSGWVTQIRSEPCPTLFHEMSCLTCIRANWIGVHDSMVNMSWYGNQLLNQTAFTNLTIDGDDVGQFKIVDDFWYVRVFGAGHAMVGRLYPLGFCYLVSVF
jgi:carboxypeptidase C (cathepsin A)